MGDYACYDVPAPVFGGTAHRLLAHHYSVDGVAHLELRYGPAPCTSLPDWSQFTQWWGDYVR